jgi:hypothetical protein
LGEFKTECNDFFYVSGPDSLDKIIDDFTHSHHPPNEEEAWDAIDTLLFKAWRRTLKNKRISFSERRMRKMKKHIDRSQSSG